MSIDYLRKTVAIIAAGKGGVGKTTHAVKVAEWYRRKGLRPMCFNADAFNTGLALDSYPALEAKRLELVRNGEIVKDGFHQMLESFAKARPGPIKQTPVTTRCIRPDSIRNMRVASSSSRGLPQHQHLSNRKQYSSSE